MRSLLSSIMLPSVIWLFPITLPAQTGPSKPVLQCKSSELDRHPFEIGGMSLTITTLKKDVIWIQLKNNSDEFRVFQPEDLNVVGGDGNQLYIQTTTGSAPMTVTTRAHIAPGATLKQGYGLNHFVHFPAKIYFNEKLLAEISD